MIPDAAVEAAARVLFENSPVSRGAKPWSQQFTDRIKEQFRADARDALEAAAPYLMSKAAEELADAGYEVKPK